MPRLTQEVASLEYLKFDLKLNDEFNNVRGNCKCITKDGYFVYANLSNLRTNKKPKIFSNKNPYSVYNMNKWCEDNNKPYKLISDKYEHNSIKLKWLCLKCNNPFEVDWNSIHQKDIYNCPHCSSKNKAYTLEHIKTIIKEKLPNIEIELDEYVRIKQKVKCICKRENCNNEWYAPIESLINGRRDCEFCGSGGLHGGYNITLAERNKDKWSRIKSIVYIIECKDSYEHFYKIGITNRKLTQRFEQRNIPYEYMKIIEYKTNLYDAVYIEKELHTINKYTAYTPLKKFDGYTECFKDLNFGHIQRVIDRYYKHDSITNAKSYR